MANSEVRLFSNGLIEFTDLEGTTFAIKYSSILAMFKETEETDEPYYTIVTSIQDSWSKELYVSPQVYEAILNVKAAA